MPNQIGGGLSRPKKRGSKKGSKAGSKKGSKRKMNRGPKKGSKKGSKKGGKRGSRSQKGGATPCYRCSGGSIFNSCKCHEAPFNIKGDKCTKSDCGHAKTSHRRVNIGSLERC